MSSRRTSLESPATSPSKPGGRHQIKRSLTEFTSPGKLQRAQHQHYHYRPDRAYDDKPPTSMPSSIMQGRHSVDLPRSENVSPMMSPNESRRGSVLIQKDGDDRTESRDSKEKLPGDREGSLLSTNKLRQSLIELNAFSTDTTRHLDETYYSVLEKMTSLQNTVNALKDLAETSRDIQVGFDRISQDLESDIKSQLNGMGQFKGQQNTIESLQGRIHKGRQRIEALAARVEVVRQRVEGWERADKAWQERTRKRLRITWTALSILVLVFLVLVVTVDYSPEVVARGDVQVQNMERSATVERKPPNTTYSPYKLTREETETKPKTKPKTDTKLVWKTPIDDGERLRAFDEL
ncbi:hypothetical protein PT974_08652 [Cladobotryum mycophilum]|uniref:Uncharacterized protein n=1 Tax=Cladobotryum mycophilum TaxID=491253 RepID=A0ABR0SE27_9HYPO